MIISNSRNFIFVHIMKTAGTSITRAMVPSLQWNDLILGSTLFGDIVQRHYRKQFGLHKHSRAQEVQKIIGKDLWGEYFTFTFVRHPYSRAKSLYTWVKTMVYSDGVRRFFPFKIFRRKEFWKFSGTQAFLESKSFSDFIRNDKVLTLATGFQPQSDWVVDEKKQVIVDHFGKVENIKDSFNFITNKIGLNPIELGEHNKSRIKKRDQIEIKKDDYEYLYNRFKLDFEIFDYVADPDEYESQNL